MGEVAGAIEESGLRAVVAPSLYDRDAERGLRETEALLERFGADPARSRVWAGLGPHATDTCGPDLLRRVAALAERSGGRVFIHLAQAEAEVAAVRARGSAGCAAYLDELGLLGPTVVVAHGTYLTDGEADLVGGRGTAVAHCPSSNAKIEGRGAPLGRERGLRGREAARARPPSGGPRRGAHPRRRDTGGAGARSARGGGMTARPRKRVCASAADRVAQLRATADAAAGRCPSWA